MFTDWLRADRMPPEHVATQPYMPRGFITSLIITTFRYYFITFLTFGDICLDLNRNHHNFEL